MRATTWVLPTALAVVFGAVTFAQQGTGGSAKAAPARPAAKPATSTIKTTATVKQLMGMITPGSNVILGVASEAPKTDEDWTRVEQAAITVAEGGNLLMMGGRAVDRGAWMKMSRAMVDAGAEVLKAAKAKNADAVGDAGDKMNDTCDACHEKYKAP